MVDAHCHLYEFEDIDAVVQKANKAGVDAMICAGADLETSRKSVELSKIYPEVFAAIGAYPEGGFQANKVEFLKLINEKVVAIGECGLDYFENTTEEEKVKQRDLFKFNIDLAKETNLPLVVHCRNAFQDVFNLLNYDRVQMHCFTGNQDQANECLERGWHLSFGGIITFKKSDALREVAKQVPEDRLLIETDAPYLAPEPIRGERNEPANVKIVAELMAKLRGCSINQIDQITTMNAKRLFKL